jgi:hypothetical protein
VAFGALVSIYVVGMTAWGYRSWVPLGALLGTLLVLALLAWGTRQPEEQLTLGGPPRGPHAEEAP